MTCPFCVSPEICSRVDWRRSTVPFVQGDRTLKCRPSLRARRVTPPPTHSHTSRQKRRGNGKKGLLRSTEILTDNRPDLPLHLCGFRTTLYVCTCNMRCTCLSVAGVCAPAASFTRRTTRSYGFLWLHQDQESGCRLYPPENGSSGPGPHGSGPAAVAGVRDLSAGR